MKNSINEISSFPPKGFKSYKPKINEGFLKAKVRYLNKEIKRLDKLSVLPKPEWMKEAEKEAYLDKVLVAIVVVVLTVFALNWMVDNFFTPARAQTIELRDCRTNEECLRLYCEGAPNYVQDEKLTALCV